MCSTSVCRAASLTAMRAETFSSAVWASGYIAESTRERCIDECQVATTGPRAAQQDRIDRLGESGSWMCSTSKLPLRIQRRTRRVVTGPNAIFAFDPL